MSQTQDKFEEAEYFLNEMSKSVRDWIRFKYNLSAFLCAFRSVTFVMQKEYKDVNGFEDWYASQQDRLRSD